MWPLCFSPTFSCINITNYLPLLPFDPPLHNLPSHFDSPTYSTPKGLPIPVTARVHPRALLIRERHRAMHKGSAVGGDCRPLTTFVRTDTNTFREIVQRLTGPSDNAASPPHEAGGAPGPSKAVGMKRPTAGPSGSTTLLERRQYNRNRPKLQIVKPPSRSRSVGSLTGSISTDVHTLLHSPSLTPTSNFSKLSLLQDSREEPAAPPLVVDRKEEEKAIKERRFYLHPSPRSRTRTAQPELLDLFPMTSPRLAGMDPGGG